MRLPFLQLQSDLIAHGAPAVAMLAGCSPVEALGHIAFLQAWAVAQADDSAPPDGWVRGPAAARLVEAAAQWKGERGRLIQALQDVGLVAVVEGDIQVLHLDPYRAAWEKNAKAKQRMAKVRGRSSGVERTFDEHSERLPEGAAKFGCQTQTQTQTQNLSASQESQASPADQEEVCAQTTCCGHPEACGGCNLSPASQHDDGLQNTPEKGPSSPHSARKAPGAGSGGGELVLSVQESARAAGKGEKKPRALSAAEQLYARVQEAREKACALWAESRAREFERADSGAVDATVRQPAPFVPDGWAAARVNKELGPFAKDEAALQRFGQALNEYLFDPFGATREPPWSLSYFIKGEVRARYESRAARSAGGGA